MFCAMPGKSNMGLKEKTLKNSFYSAIAQIIMIFLRFLSRYFLIRYIGVELVGLSDTISSTVGMLSLAEVGIESAISYSLYTPIKDGDKESINKIMNVFRRLYAILSGIILLIGINGLFFLKYILKGIDINFMVYCIYFLYVGNTCISYLLCHRRTLLYADIQEYIVKKIDIATNILFTVLGLIIILVTHDIIFYTITLIFQTFVSNFWIHVSSRKIYPYLKNGPVDKKILRNTLLYAKDLFWGTVAGFVYGSTDNIIVSGFLGTVYVGYLGNYSLVSKSIQTIVTKVLSPITPTIGRLQREDISKKQFNSIFYKYHQICYLSALAVTVPMLVLFDGFIIFAFGQDYILSSSVKYLLAYVFYVNIAAFAYGNILATSGAFKLLRQVEMTGAVANIVTSLILVNIMGLPGVFLGTAITVTIQWVIRSLMVYINNLCLGGKAWFLSMIKEVYKIAIVIVSYIFGSYLYSIISVPFIIKFVICGSLSMVLSIVLYLIMYWFDDRFTPQFVLSILKRRRT